MSAPPSLDSHTLLRWFEAGDYSRLLQLLPQVLQQAPQWAMGWKLLGASQLGSQLPAAEAFQRAAQLDPQDATNWRNLGLALEREGALAQAEAAWQQALAQQPQHGPALLDLGRFLQQQQRLPEALTMLERAAQARPGHIPSLLRWSEVLRELGQRAPARAVLDQAMAHAPQDPEVWNALGNWHWAQADWSAAQRCYQQALQQAPDLPQAHANLADVLRRLGQREAAQVHAERAVALAPTQVNFLNSLGVLHCDRWALGPAREVLQRALALAPNDAMLHSNLGNVMRDLGLPAAARAHYQQALALRPQDQHAQSSLVLLLNYDPDASGEALRAQAEQYQHQLSASGVREAPMVLRQRTPDSALRIGLVSADLHAHPVGFFLADVIEPLRHTPDVQLLAFSNSHKRDAHTTRLQAAVSHWSEVQGLDDDQAAAHIRAQGVDVLLDLSGHTAGHRLGVFARRAAPRQCSWLGYFGSTGLAAMDALLADPWLVPDALRPLYTEQVLHLPHTRFCMGQMPDVALPVVPADRPLTLGCFNHLAKINDTVLGLWAQILQARPDAQLVLKALPLDDASTRAQLLARLAALGVAPERVRLLGSSPREQYLQAYGEIDIALDPYPFAGGTTSVDALWMGVPLVTRVGQTLASRQGLSVLNNVGLTEGIAHDDAAYVQAALAMAEDLARWRRERGALRERLQRSPLMQPQAFAQDWAQQLRALAEGG